MDHAQALVGANDMDGARSVYQSIADEVKEHCPSRLMLGILIMERGNFDSAKAHFEECLQIDPYYTQALYQLGRLNISMGHIDDAIGHFKQVIKLEPSHFEANIDLGNCLTNIGDYEGAIQRYSSAVKLEPKSVIAHFNLGTVAEQIGRFELAVTHLEQTIKINPEYVDAWNNLGLAKTTLGQSKEAEKAFLTAISISPMFASPYTNLGILYKQLGNYEKAEEFLHHSLQIDPKTAPAWNNLGSVQEILGNLDEAISSFQQSLTFEPEQIAAKRNLVNAAQHSCDWPILNEFLDIFDEHPDPSAYRFLKPFPHLTLLDDPAENYLVARKKAPTVSDRFNSLETSVYAATSNTHQPIRICYLSSDFHNHATSHLMKRLFSCHNRKRVHVTVISFGLPDSSSYRQEIKEGADIFIDHYGKSHADIANSIQENKIQILIELKGHTIKNCLKVCAMKPAPVIVSWLGFPGTTGSQFIDYIITDKIVTPPEEQQYFSEKFVYMPNSYQVNDCKQTISQMSITRSEIGLPVDGFVFCSFNGNYKIDPLMFDVWMKLLHEIPSSVLWLLKSNDASERNLLTEAEKRDISSSRLIFSDHVAKDQHLARLRLADVALDTRICGGHTTTSDALWAEVPVITLYGQHFASRVSASLLRATQMDELITHSLEEYRLLATELANNPYHLHQIKKKLSVNRLTTSLFDTTQFVQDLEQAYEKIWSQFLSEEPPKQITIS